MRKFKDGDKVSVKSCEELEMPCSVEGLDDWIPKLTSLDGRTIYMYKVTGRHAKRGNAVSVRVSESQLELWS